MSPLPKVSLYDDSVLLELMQNFTLPTWTLLEIVGGVVNEMGEPNDSPQPRRMTMTDLADCVKLSQQNFRIHVALLQGANAITLTTGYTDARRKEIAITPNGQRMLELR